MFLKREINTTTCWLPRRFFRQASQLYSFVGGGGCLCLSFPPLNHNLLIWMSICNSYRHVSIRLFIFFQCFGLIYCAAFGQMPKSSSRYSRWSTYLHDAYVHSWLDSVISVIVLISQSQLACRKNGLRGRRRERQGDKGVEGGITNCAFFPPSSFSRVLYFHPGEWPKKQANSIHFNWGQLVTSNWKIYFCHRQNALSAQLSVRHLPSNCVFFLTQQ